MKESLELIKRGIDEVLTEDDLVSKLKSKNCPPAIPICPEHSEILLIKLIFIFSGIFKFLWLKISKAIVKSELPLSN